jgi:hypothetical protein
MSGEILGCARKLGNREVGQISGYYCISGYTLGMGVWGAMRRRIYYENNPEKDSVSGDRGWAFWRPKTTSNCDY